MPGGRPRGSQGVNRQALRAMLQDRYPDWEPAMQMAEWANDPNLPVDQRMAATRDLLDRLIPKLKAIEHSGPDGGPIPAKLLPVDAEL